MYKILIADDEQKIREVLREYAEYEGHEVVEAVDGMQAVELSKQEDFDIIILDIMMPRLDGFSACKEIRKFKQTPVLMLSARGEEYDKLFGFEIGADDYVVKPFSPKELMLRINAIMNRVRPSIAQPRQTESFGGLTVDLGARTVSVDGQRVELSPKEYDLLTYLMKNKGLALTREQLLTNVWGYDFYGDDRTLDTHIKLLRKRLGPYSGFIVTLRGVGYRFEAPDV